MAAPPPRLSSKFVFSPFGHGKNNHREWEALAAGAIPVVDFHDTHADLFAGLPVVEVMDWSLVTPQWLASEWERIRASNMYDLTKAYFPFWFDRLINHMQ